MGRFSVEFYDLEAAHSEIGMPYITILAKRVSDMSYPNQTWLT
jgi:hypothetical protein